MVTLYVYMLVRRLIQGKKCVKARFWVIWRVLAEEVPRCEDPGRHIVHARLGDRPVLDVCGEIRAVIRRVRIECNITRHGHVQPGHGADRRMLGRPVGHYKALEAELVLKNAVDRIVVLARVCPIDEVVRTHDRCEPSHDTTQEWGHVDLMLSPVINVGALHRTLVLLLTVPVFQPSMGTYHNCQRLTC
jgi:hypothetical protein